MNRTNRKWTEEEDSILLSQVKRQPQNLSRSFLAVSERTGRSQQAVSNRWYTVVSKKPDSVCFFTASPKHVSRNRKNGVGVESNINIWQRLMSVIRNL